MYVERQVYHWKCENSHCLSPLLVFYFWSSLNLISESSHEKTVVMTENSCDNLISLMRNLEGSDQTDLYSSVYTEGEGGRYKKKLN